MTTNKYHWYDGWFYDTVIAPNQDELFIQIKNLLVSQSTVIDVGCGTGRLVFLIAGKCKSLIGIDLSKRNIDRANKTLLKYPDPKIAFLHSNISDINNAGIKNYDFAILTYVIHEVDEDERIDLLKQIAQVADKIIIGDYRVPKPKGFAGFFSEAIEFIAGKAHYRNYNSYMANGGIYYLADKAGLKIISEIPNNQLINHIVVLEKKYLYPDPDL